MKTHMNIYPIIIAILVALLSYFLATYIEKNWKSNSITYEAKGGGARVFHNITIDPDTYDILARYAFKEDITLTEATKRMALVFPPKSISIGHILDLSAYRTPLGDGRTLVEYDQLNCGTTTALYNPIMGTNGYVYRVLGKEGYVLIDKTIFPDRPVDLLLTCKDSTPLELTLKEYSKGLKQLDVTTE